MAKQRFWGGGCKGVAALFERAMGVRWEEGWKMAVEGAIGKAWVVRARTIGREKSVESCILSDIGMMLLKRCAGVSV